ncbi:MAG: hypothetical protein EA401_13230 [Planctomycetota bacterium]|nr:MAG: hypothetical protein EA401_13230 [Planctomycetota bacterium]
MRCWIAGDVHHQFLIFLRRAREWVRRGRVSRIYQLGDFGIDAAGVEELLGTPIRFPCPVFVIDGNHDDRAIWDDASTVRDLARRCQLHLCPRGTLHDGGGRPILLMGGALHVHQRQREGVHHNALTENEVHAIIARLNIAPRLILTHSCPSILGLHPHAGGDVAHFHPDACASPHHPGPDPHNPGEPALNILWRWLIAQTVSQTPLWAFGHFHRPQAWHRHGIDLRCVGTVDSRDLSNDARLLLTIPHNNDGYTQSME